MKISGFTIVKDAVINDYPVKEAILSILPVVDEMIVSIGESADTTEELIRSINSEKIKIVHSVWDSSIREGGKTLAVETDKAYRHIDPESDWAFYIQADEVVHEKYHDVIRKAAKLYLDNKKVDGLLCNYLHFYCNYDYVGDSRRWYNKEVRVIRNDKTIGSYRDAQGFRRGKKKLAVKPVDAFIYHYGWVKDLNKIKQKFSNIAPLWNGDEKMDTILKEVDSFDYNNFDSLARFSESHPCVMQERISKKNREINLNIHEKKFSLKNRLLYRIEKMTGKRLFDFKNYKIV